MFKYCTTLNCVLEILLFPAVIILKLFLTFLDPVYKNMLHVKPPFKFSLKKHFWSLTSNIFLSSLMTIHLFVFHGILSKLCATHQLMLDLELHTAHVY